MDTENKRLRMERDILKKGMVGSTGRRNGLGEGSGWCLEAKRFPWPGIELERDCIEVGLAMRRQVGLLGEVLAQRAVGVLVAPALPRAAGIAEVDRCQCRLNSDSPAKMVLIEACTMLRFPARRGL